MQDVKGSAEAEVCTGCEQGGGVSTIGATPAGRLVRCALCGCEDVVPDAAAQALCAAQDADVASAGAERARGVLVGPVPVGPVRRLRHDEQVAAMVEAARHAVGTPESVVLYLRWSGFEVVGAAPVLCACPVDLVDGGEIRNPACGIHGDDYGDDPGGDPAVAVDPARPA